MINLADQTTELICKGFAALTGAVVCGNVGKLLQFQSGDQ